MDKYPSQINRKILWLSPDHIEIAKHLAQAWTATTGLTWSAKGVVEALLDFANEGEIEPVSDLKKMTD